MVSSCIIRDEPCTRVVTRTKTQRDVSDRDCYNGMELGELGAKQSLKLGIDGSNDAGVEEGRRVSL